MALTCIIDEAGITAPDYASILGELIARYRGIYGEDVYLEADSQDGQFLALIALAISDCNAQAVAVYNSFSPATAVGTGLSRNVKLNGLARNVASKSTVDLLITGDIGTIILNGIAGDEQNRRWMLPASVTIPISGEITVTASAEQEGAAQAPANSITSIITPTRGWASVNNPAAAAPGEAVELDAQLRRRQSRSTASPSRTVLEGIRGAVEGLDGVTRLAAYENDTDTTDGSGIPSHSIAFVVEGGNAAAIGSTIALRKAPGTGTFGTTTETVIDSFGVPRNIRFSRPTIVDVSGEISISALTGYTTAIGAKIKQAVAAAINARTIGQSVLLTKLYGPANLSGDDGDTFDLLSIELARDGGSLAMANIAIAWDEAASCDAADLVVTVVP